VTSKSEGESTDQIWADDLLGRAEDAEFLKAFLLKRVEERGAQGKSKSYVLNLDAGWGHGKSFFLERFGKSLRGDQYLVAQVNAWNDDHAEDPLLSVMAAIDGVVAPLIGSKTKAKRTWASVKKTGEAVVLAAAKGALTHAASKIIGEGVNDVLREIKADALSDVGESAAKSVGKLIDKKAEDLLESFKAGKRSIEAFRTELKQFLDEISDGSPKPPLFVLVDELDRCRPSYAISLLERVKHLFSIDNVIFIFATDLDQLQHAIKVVYGEAFDSKRYLFRFFDRTYGFEKPSLEEFSKALIGSAALDPSQLSLPEQSTLDEFLAGGFSFFGLSLRDAEQVFDIIRSVCTVWDRPRLPLEMIVLFPLAVAQQQGIHPLAMNTEFVDRMKDLSGKKGGSISSWRFKFHSYSNRQHEILRIPGLDLFKMFASLCTSSLPSIQRKDENDPQVQWVVSRFRYEFMILHNNTWNPQNEPSSLLRKYPQLVRSAGRLLPS
jgi:hypothetical protein